MNQKIYSLLLLILALASPSRMLADWDETGLRSRVTILEKLSADHQSITIRYPEINYVGIDDGIYNVSISTPEGVVFYKKNPNNNAMTVDGFGYHCITGTSNWDEAGGGDPDVRYRFVTIYLKPFTTLSEYRNFKLTISLELYIDYTRDNASPRTKIPYTRTYSYSDLATDLMATPTIHQRTFDYSGNTLQIDNVNIPSDKINWTPYIKYIDSKDGIEKTCIGTKEGFGPNYHMSITLDEVDPTDTQRTCTIKSGYYTETVSDGYYHSRYLESDDSEVLYLSRRQLSDLKLTQEGSGVRLDWKISSGGNPGGTVIVNRYDLNTKETKTIKILPDTETSCYDSNVDLKNFIGYYYVSYQGPYDTKPDEKSSSFYSNVPVWVLNDSTATLTRKNSALYDDYLRMNDDKYNWRNIVKEIVIDPSVADFAIKDASYLFSNFRNATSIQGLEYLNLAEATNMSHMFFACENLTSLDLSTFRTDNVRDMSYMFNDCKSLPSLDLSSFRTDSVKTTAYMFTYCKSLTSLDLSSFSCASLDNCTYMFVECINLKTIYTHRFLASNGKDGVFSSVRRMFYNCPNLVGKVPYDPNHPGADMATFDGYFTPGPQVGDLNRDGILSMADLTLLIDRLKAKDHRYYYPADLNDYHAVTPADITPLRTAILSHPH